MRKLPARALLALVWCLLLWIVSCSGMPMATSGRHLESITVTPASADARNFPSESVQFTATGHFNMDPMTAATPVTWSIVNMTPTEPPPLGVSIDPSTGVAQCSGFMGMVTVMASEQTGPPAPLEMGMSTTNITGSAQLICP